MSEQELAIVWKLRRVLSGLEGQQALELLLQRLKKAHTNNEFLRSVGEVGPEAEQHGHRLTRSGPDFGRRGPGMTTVLNWLGR